MSALQNLEAELQEVHRLLNQTQRAVVRGHLHGLLNELLESKRQALAAGSASAQPSGARTGSLSEPDTGAFAGLSLGSADGPDLRDGLHRSGSKTEQVLALLGDAGSAEGDEQRVGSDVGGRDDGNALQQGGAARSSSVDTGAAVETIISPYDPVWTGPSESSFHPGNLALRGGAGASPDLGGYTGQQHYQQHMVPAQRSATMSPHAGGMRSGLNPYHQNAPAHQMQQWSHDGGTGNSYMSGHGMPGFMHASQRPPPPPPPPAAGGYSGQGMLSAGHGSMGPHGGLPHVAAPPQGYGGLMLDGMQAGPAFPAWQYGIDLSQFSSQELAAASFRTLTTYSWEQSDMLVKIYVPLRGVQTDMLRATFSHMGLEVKVLGLQARNYVFDVQTLYKPINADGCHVAASKTKKNILIMLQKLHWDTADEKHWKDLSLPGS